MELTKKIKIALDETRMLILGAQILLGFQFRGVFGNGYDQRPSHLRYLDGIALLPMICVVALLITPGPYHRIVEAGEDSKSFHRLVTVIINLALLPFAIALSSPRHAFLAKCGELALELRSPRWRSPSGTDFRTYESGITPSRNA